MKPGRIRYMIEGVCEIIDGIVVIATFGGYDTSLTFKFIAWAELRYIEQRKRERNE